MDWMKWGWYIKLCAILGSLRMEIR
jgi:hypothetical protein